MHASAGTHIPRHKRPLPVLFFGGGDEQLGDGSRYNPTVIQFLRDDWVHQQLQERCGGQHPPSFCPLWASPLTRRRPAHPPHTRRRAAGRPSSQSTARCASLWARGT
jgi:hypothetical protein